MKNIWRSFLWIQKSTCKHTSNRMQHSQMLISFTFDIDFFPSIYLHFPFIHSFVRCVFSVHATMNQLNVQRGKNFSLSNVIPKAYFPCYTISNALMRFYSILVSLCAFPFQLYASYEFIFFESLPLAEWKWVFIHLNRNDSKCWASMHHLTDSNMVRKMNFHIS